MSDQSIISLDRVTKRFGSVTAVDDVSIEIGRGEFFALLGPSGCGKTTLLRMLGGFEVPDEGEVHLRTIGTAIRRVRSRRHSRRNRPESGPTGSMGRFLPATKWAAQTRTALAPPTLPGPPLTAPGAALGRGLLE